MRLPWLASAVLLSALLAAVGADAAGTSAVNWAVSGGGPGIDDADGVGTDANGRIVISGGFEGANADVFATAYGKRGRLLWTRHYGGPGADQAFDNDVDRRGDAAITGSFNDTVDFGSARSAAPARTAATRWRSARTATSTRSATPTDR
jgi:hypothetical protein